MPQSSSSPELREVDESEVNPKVEAPKRRRVGISDGDVSAPSTVPQLLHQLDVVEQPTSGFQNNCLWFSTQVAMGRLTAGKQFSEAGEAASREGRRQIYEELLHAWPVTDVDAVGPNDTWWAGYSLRQIKHIHRSNGMMCEPHLFALANLLQRSIMVVDAHHGPIRVIQYSLGFVVKSPLMFSEVCLARRQDDEYVWVRLHAHHFRGLVRQVSL